MMTLTEPTFLYPQSRQFPFDEVCEQIVRELEARNWDVPGIAVDFHEYGSGEQKYRMVSTVKGDDFKLWFCRVQGRLGTSWNDTAAVTEICIPKMEIHVYEDESGPRFHTYVGDDWEQDKQWFMTSSKLNCKLRGEPRRALSYEGAWSDGYLYRGSRPPFLKANSDLGRQYMPEGDESTVFNTSEVFDQFTQWLQENVLGKITALPPAEEKINIFSTEATPLPENIGPIFCFGGDMEAVRLTKGKQDISQLDPGERYAFHGGYRLVALGEHDGEEIPKVAYDGFLWCGFGNVDATTPITNLEVPGHYRWTDREQFVFRITPNRANGIYVADHAVYEEVREFLVGIVKEEEPDREYLTDREVSAFTCARGRTIVPITEYDGSYKQPIVLINREVDLDEVELVSGPWPGYQYVKLITEHSREARSLLDQALSALEEYFQAFGGEKRNDYEGAVEALSVFTLDDEVLFGALEQAGSEIFRFRPVHTHGQVVSSLVDNAYEMRRLGLL